MQVSSKLRRSKTAYLHWCPGCGEMHPLPDGWTFDGHLESPTFQPSFKHSGHKRVFVGGKWTGEWVRDDAGNPVPSVCHYVLTNGVLNFCSDSSHELRGQSVPLPDLPAGYADD